MAAAQGLYAEGLNVSSSTTTWVDVCTIAAASFTANKKYLIISSAFITHTSSANEVRLRLVHGTTPTVFDDASLAYEETANAQETCASFMTMYTQPGTTELVKLQISVSSTNTGNALLGQIFALNLDDVGVQSTDYFYTEDLVDYTTTGSKVSKASVTFTPNGTDDWLVFGSFMQVPGSITTSYLADLNDSVAGILTSMTAEGEDLTNELRGHLMMWVGAPSNASHTFSIRFSHQTTAGTVRSNRIFALNLNKFRQHAFSFAAAGETPATTPSWTTTRTVAPTPDVTGDWFIWGSYGFDTSAGTTDDLATRLQINPSGGGLASNPNYGDTSPGIDAWDTTDVLPENIFKMLSLTSGASRTANLDVQIVAGTAQKVVNRALVAFSMELPAAGGQSQAPRSMHQFRQRQV